ncbi:hypothetical protein EGC79_01850 [Shewanella vesiculosa]|uniref:hypothetical protein n=1 Tax=Shewanella vesiculosa TaxID=518738 RepID=UPI000F4FE890|nr:hypothetical protein [Shewanella vesiculosa]RPA55986.1 hypothetical protein EGC79_01850 [Shewanella vesiculosa]UJL42512.1 hypothetical protein KDH10_003706 [Shewanella vesiculosa]
MDGKSLIVILIMVSASASASAEVYKCADGKYQADPCDDQSEPLDLSNVGSLVAPSRGYPENLTNETTDARLQDTSVNPRDKKAEIAQYLRKQKIEREIRNLEKERKKAFKDRDDKIEQLRTTGKRANNNLAGATWQQSLAQEMTAVMQQGSTEVESIDRQISALRSELKQL